MSKINKLSSLILMFIILGISANYALASEVLELNLVEAVELALEQNLDVQMSKLQLDHAQLTYQKQQVELEQYPSKRRFLQVEAEFNQAQANFKETRNNLILAVVEKYFQLQQATLKIQMQGKQVDLNQALLKERKLKVAGGYERPLALLQQETEYLLVFSRLEQAKQEYEYLLWDFQILLGLEQIADLKLTTEMLSITEWVITEEDAIKLALENSLQLEMLQGQITLAKLKLQEGASSNLTSFEIEQIENNIEYLRLSYEQKSRELKNYVRRQYQLWDETDLSLEYYQQNLNQAQENMVMIQKQIDADLKMEKELLASEILLLQVRYNRQNAIQQSYLNQLKLQKTLGLEMGVAVQ